MKPWLPSYSRSFTFKLFAVIIAIGVIVPTVGIIAHCRKAKPTPVEPVTKPAP